MYITILSCFWTCDSQTEENLILCKAIQTCVNVVEENVIIMQSFFLLNYINNTIILPIIYINNITQFPIIYINNFCFI